jgi:hypothetical protein
MDYKANQQFLSIASAKITKPVNPENMNLGDQLILFAAPDEHTRKAVE